MPHFVGHGSHELNKIKHRFIVMPRFGRDIWSLFLENGRKFPLHTVYRLAIQMVRAHIILQTINQYIKNYAVSFFFDFLVGSVRIYS